MNYDENQLKNDLNIETQTTKVSKLLDNIDDINSKILSLNHDKEKVKNEFMRGKQRYKCKNCGCNYTGGPHYFLSPYKGKKIR